MQGWLVQDVPPSPPKNYDYGEHAKIDNDKKSIKLDVKNEEEFRRCIVHIR